MSHSTPPSTPGNQTNLLLAALPAAEYERLALHLRAIKMPVNRVLHEAQEVVDRVYFMDSGMTSLVLDSESGVTVEVGVIGREGMVGMSAISPNVAMPVRAMVQIKGSAHWMPARALQEEFYRGGKLQDLLLRQSHELLVQTAQGMLCNRLHTVEQRLARWLLTTSYKTDATELELTQEFLAMMLGVRRSGVSVAAGVLRDAGLIDYTRGQICITDVKGLENVACECYNAIRDNSQALAMKDAAPRTH